MSDHDDEPHLIRISQPGPNAVSEPIFLIKVDEVFYITLGVWEYDPKKIVNPEQREGYDRVAEYFRHASEHGTGHTVPLKIGDPPSMTSTTKPPHPKPIPTNPPHRHPKPDDQVR
jgi:hypothetical protein